MTQPTTQDPQDRRNDGLSRVEFLLEAGREVAAQESLEEMLMSLITVSSDLVGAERSTVFLHDPRNNELYAEVAEDAVARHIRMSDTEGVAGHVFTTGDSVIIEDAYADDRFNPEIDRRTGFQTESLLTVPIRSAQGDLMGVVQAINKKEGAFDETDLRLLEGLARQAAVALHGARTIERMREAQARELEFLDIVSDITSEIELASVLSKVMSETTRLLEAERSTLFLNDEKSDELWSQVGEGLDSMEIRFPNHLGIAGTVFQTGESVNIPHAYADLRFNPGVDRQTGFFTRSILCTPVVNKEGTRIGVTQVLNKKGGSFTEADESRLRAFTAQIAIALENAKLFNDVQSVKNYNQSMLESMSNGVVTLDEEGKVTTCNVAGQRILGVTADVIRGRPVDDVFGDDSAWIVDRVERVTQTGEPETVMDHELRVDDVVRSVNLTVLPLVSGDGERLGTLLMLEDISSEKRMKSTMSRYMDPGLADQLLAEGEEMLGGRDVTATILFSDIRSFTTITEELGAQGTVTLLNEYFTLMVDLLQEGGGMLDKFIGDAIMAAFGIPVPGEDDEDRAVRTAIEMIRNLDRWNAEREEKGLRGVEIGIGLNTDTVVSGNIGSAKRMDYTVMGDGVNLASRLEALCKKYHARILISEHTRSHLKGAYRLRDVDDVVVKGKTEPVRIYEILDYHTPQSFPNVMEVVGHFGEGRRLYREGSWDKASHAFERVLDLHPGDELARMYVDRCRQLLDEPPEGEWRGVWVMTAK